MKSFREFVAEVYRPNSESEKNFIDKHVTVKHADRNGNKDDVFNTSKVKKSERKADRHGYEPGEDEAVYEAKQTPVYVTHKKTGAVGRLTTISGDKSSVDVTWNKTGRTTSHPIEDVERLKEEVEELDESASKVADHLIKRYGDNVRMSHVRSASGDFGIDSSKISKAVKKKLNKNMLDEEQLDEISKKTLGSYVNRALNDVRNSNQAKIRWQTSKNGYAEKSPKEMEDFHTRKAGNREGGIRKATDRLTKEDIINNAINKYIKEDVYTLDEKVLKSVLHLSESQIVDIMDLFESLNEDNQKLMYRTLQLENGIDEILDFVIENQLDEISKKTLKSYLEKTEGPRDYDTPREFRNRMVGQSLAKGKLSKGTKKRSNQVKVKATNEAKELDEEHDDGWYTHQEMYGKVSKEHWKKGWRYNHLKDKPFFNSNTKTWHSSIKEDLDEDIKPYVSLDRNSAYVLDHSGKERAHFNKKTHGDSFFKQAQHHLKQNYKQYSKGGE